MKRALKLLLWSMLVVVLAVFALRNVPTRPDRAHARALLDAPTPPVAGRDATDALWLVRHDVPADRVADVGRAHRRYLDEQEALRRAGQKAKAARLAVPLAAWPRHVDAPEDAPGLCTMAMGSKDCLPVVRANPDASAALVARHAAQLRATRALADFDGARYGVIPGIEQAGLDFKAGRRLFETAIALRFVNGETDAALADACRDIAGWRRIGADNDFVVISSVAVARVRRDLRLLADMLAELPAATPLPPECGQALATTTDAELDMCPAMRGEFEYDKAALGGRSEKPPSGAYSWLIGKVITHTFDQDHALTAFAPQLARFCGPTAIANARADRSARALPPANLTCGSVEKFVRPADCWILQIAASDYLDQDVDRRTDQAAHLALMRTIVWLRAQSADPVRWPALLRERPADLGLRREPVLDLEAGTISVPALPATGEKVLALRVLPDSPVPPK